jgi:hypothetical protein
MATDMLSSETELLDRQRTLQMEAEQVARDIMLMELVQPLGDPVLVGSAALGLMVWRDLDVTVVCPRFDIDAVVQVGLPRRPLPRPLVSLGPRDDWKSDIWFVDEQTNRTWRT